MFSTSEILSFTVFPSLLPEPGNKIHPCQSSFRTTLTHKHIRTQSQPIATNNTKKRKEKRSQKERQSQRIDKGGERPGWEQAEKWKQAVS